MSAAERMDAITIAADVAAGRTTALAMAEEVIARLSAYDAIQPQAWIARVAPDALRAAARAIDARVGAGEALPLAGVPFAVKDNIDVAGLETTAACPAFAYAPERSATVVEKLLAAGALCVGKTNLDQFATGLNGTRSPYGAPRCVYNLAYVSGGSSSGSAVVVAAGIVAFALGTDTAGSGRVPAAFNHLIGLKPTKGRWSTRGLTPACRSLDCISVFANTLADALLVDDLVAGFDAEDDYSRPLQDVSVAPRRIGVPLPHQLNFCGDGQSARLYAKALDRLRAAGAEIVEVDIQPLSDAAALLYNGPWVAERTAAVEPLLRSDPDAIDPVVREIVAAGVPMTAVETFNGIYKLAGYARYAETMWAAIDMLALPTAPTIYRVVEMLAAPVALNSQFGIYTNFVNLLDMAALAIPVGFRDNGTGFGITLMGPAWTDRALADAAQHYLAAGEPFVLPSPDLEGRMETVQLAVVGAHLKDMPLHWQLTSRDATFIRAARTAPSYRLYALANSTPPKPALIHDPSGGSIELEIYEMDVTKLGSFMVGVPAPLAIGTVTLEDGTEVKGFVAEPRAMEGAEDITALGGWRAYMAR